MTDGTEDQLLQILDRDAYRRLIRPRNSLALTHLGLRIGFHVGSLALATKLAADRHILTALLVMTPHLAAWSFLGWAGLGHELFHRNVFTSRSANGLLFKICSVLTWNNYAFFEITHPIHHRNTLGPEDVEANTKGHITPRQALGMFSFDLVGFIRRLRVLFMNATGRVPGGAKIQALIPEESLDRRRVRDGARIVLLAQSALVLVFVLAGAPILIIGVTLAPFLLSGFNRVLANLQHYGLSVGAPDTRYDQSSRTVRLGPVGSFFYANMNLHLAHHVWPGIPYYNLPEADRLLTGAGRHLYETKGFWEGLTLLSQPVSLSSRPSR